MTFERRMKSQAQHTVFTRLSPSNWEHLKPLSVYSKMVTWEQKPTLDQPRQFVKSFINLKTGVVNNHVNKRKLEHSSHDDGYKTPAKKSFNPEVLSPDLGCFMDECSPLGQLDTVSPFAIPTSLDETHALRIEIKDTVNSQHSEHIDCGSSTEPGVTKGIIPHSFKTEEVVLNLAPAFDCDIDDILCLNPVGTHSARGLSEHAQDCKCSSTFQNNAVSLPTVAHGEELGKGDERVGEGQQKLKKEMQPKAKDEEADKGYFSISFVKDLKTENSPPQSGNSQLARNTSSHLLGPQGEQYAESSIEQLNNKLLSLNDLCPLASCPPPESETSDSLDGEIEGMWDIGPPIFESSVCHSVTVKLNTTGEQKREVIEEVCGDVREPLQECLTTHNREEATSDTSYETTLPPQVQVKSDVIVLNQQTTNKPGASSLSDEMKPTHLHIPDERVPQGVQRVASQRLMFDRKVDWERGKNNYVHAVTKHMKEKGGTQDVMSELLNLMTSIADQTSARHTDPQWQHPSDLTKKNYQRRWGNTTPKWTLDEWQEKSLRVHRRFAKVPKIFQRSPFP